MKTIALLLSTLALAAATVEWNDLVDTWRMPSTDPSRLNSFFENPRTLDDAVSAGWVDACIEQPVSNLSTYCLEDDPRFCILYDSYGDVAGVQAGVLASDLENMRSMYNMSRINYYTLKTIFGQEVWTGTVYTQDPTVLKRGGSSSKWDNLTGTEGVWFQTIDGFVGIPRNLTDLDSEWTKQGCVASMGTHYFYKMYNTTACEDIPPWFLLYQGGTLSGLGFQTFGTGTIKNRTWYDKIPAGGVKLVIPNGPQCLYDWTDTYGLISIHTFFTALPWTITCS